MNSESEMLSYVRFSFIEMLATPFRLGLSILFLYLMSVAESALIFLLALTGAIVLGFCSFIPFLDYRKMISFLKSNSNMYDDAVSDFPTALSLLNDRIRLGNEYLFGKNCCTILRYTDIIRVYQSIRKVNFVERNRWLMAVDKEEKIWTLCKLENHALHSSKHNEIADQQLAKVLNFMLYKNNRIAIGYVP